MIMDEVVMDEVSLAGQSGFGPTGQPVRGVKRQAELQLNNAPTTKRQRKGNDAFLFKTRSVYYLVYTAKLSKNDWLFVSSVTSNFDMIYHIYIILVLNEDPGYIF